MSRVTVYTSLPLTVKLQRSFSHIQKAAANAERIKPFGIFRNENRYEMPLILSLVCLIQLYYLVTAIDISVLCRESFVSFVYHLRARDIVANFSSGDHAETATVWTTAAKSVLSYTVLFSLLVIQAFWLFICGKECEWPEMQPTVVKPNQ